MNRDHRLLLKGVLAGSAPGRALSLGLLTPAHYYEEVTVVHNGKTMMKIHWESGISRNPVVCFRLKGDTIKVPWVGNRRKTDAVGAEIQ